MNRAVFFIKFSSPFSNQPYLHLALTHVLGSFVHAENLNKHSDIASAYQQKGCEAFQDGTIFSY